MSSAISIRPTDSDDVKWALHTAATQIDRGSLADAIQWVKRAAQYADESSDAWRATELKNLAKELAERMWTSEPEAAPSPSAPPSLAIEVSVEDVDAEDLLDESTAPPPNPGFQSVPPGVVLRQSYPNESAPPDPIPLYPAQGPLQARPYPLNSLPGAWQPPPPAPTGFGQPEPPPPPPFAAPNVGTAAAPAFPGSGFSTAPTPAVAAAPFLTKAPTLQFGSPQANDLGQRPPPPRRRSIRPKSPNAPAPDSTKPPPPHRSSSLGGMGGPDVFSSAPPADKFAAAQVNRYPLESARPPLVSAPELLVSEVDLEGAAFASGSLLPPPPSSEPELTPEEFERDSGAITSATDETQDTLEVDPLLADLFAPEEVVEDRDSVDRMSDIVLDPSEFEHQSLLDDQEETHVLTRNVVQSMREAVRRTPQGAHESGEHEVVSPSGLPTAPPPGSVASSVASKPPASRAGSADLRRAIPQSASPPMPFEPAPSSPQSGVPTPLSVGPAVTSVAPGSIAPSSRPNFVRSVAPPSSGVGAGALTGAADVGPSTVPPLSLVPNAPSGVPSSAPPSSSRSTPPILVRRSARPDGEPASGSLAPPVSSQAPSAPLSRRSSSPGSALASHGAPSLASLAAPPPDASLTEPVVDGVNLGETRGFEDLPEEVQLSLAVSVRIERLNAGEEVSFFGAAVVTSGRVDILPAFSEEAGAVADEGDVIFTHGNLEASIDLRVVAKMDETRVAVWDPETLRQAIAECPWVADELKLIADRYLALCGATLGPLGERLDDSLRATVFQRLDVRVVNEGEVLVEVGKAIPGLLVVGGGRILIYDANGEQTGELNMGDFVFSSELLGGAKAPGTAKAARGGALILAAPRQVAHELMMSVPPLVEVLAD